MPSVTLGSVATGGTATAYTYSTATAGSLTTIGSLIADDANDLGMAMSGSPGPAVYCGMDDMPTDFQSSGTSASITLKAKSVGHTNDTIRLFLGVYANDEATNYFTGDTINTATPFADGTYGPYNFTITAAGQAASRADWNAAKMRLIWVQTVNMGTDSTPTILVDWMKVTLDNYVLVPTFTPDLAAYRFYADDGNDAGSTALGTQSTAYGASISGNLGLHLRVRIQETAAVAGAATDDYQLQYRQNGGTWTNVTTSSSVVKAFNSTWTPTGAGLGGARLTGGTGTYLNLVSVLTETGSADDRNITASNHAEFLYIIQLQYADIANADVIEFRVLRNGSTTGFTYTTTPTLNITKLAPSFVPKSRLFPQLLSQ